jgi:hypothetical protein
MRIIVLSLGIFLLVNSLSAQRNTRGKVVDQDENPIPYVKVQEPETGNICYTNDEGEFVLSYFESDSKLQFTCFGYDTLALTLPYNSNTVVFMVAKESTNTYHLGFVVGFLDFKHKNKNKNLENMTYFLGESDINRQLQMLPGIEQGSEGYSNLFVRGGEVDQNLMLFNGTPIYNPNHIFGISSTFHHRSIANTSVYRGIAPAKYGGRLSSIISLESAKTGDYSGVKGEFEMTPLNAGIYIESVKKGSSYFTLSARRSWLDLLLPAESKQNELNANIYDLQVAYGTELKSGDKLDFSVMSTRDLYFIALTGTDSANGNAPVTYGFTQKWSNLLASAKYTQHLSSKLVGEHSVHYSGYRSSNAFSQETFDINQRVNPLVEETLKRGIRDIGLSSDWEYAHSNKHFITAGIQNQARMFLIGTVNYTSINYTSQADINTVTGDPTYNASTETSVYAEDKFRFSDDVQLDGGIRATFYQFDGFSKMVAEPRVHFTYFLKNDDVLKAGYNRHNQFVNQLNLGRSGSPDNLWVPATELLLPQNIDIFEAGYERKLSTQYSLSVNAYLKNMTNLSAVSNLNDAADPAKDWRASVVQGTGRMYGAELFLQKSKGKFTGWVSYAYSKSTRTFTDLFADEFLFTYDRPHMLKVYANYTDKYSPWNFSFNYLVGSGQLFTLPIGKFRDINGQLQLEYNTLNNYRSPIYQRFDFSLGRRSGVSSLDQGWRFYVYNMFMAKNPLYLSADFTDASYTELLVNRNYLAFVPGVAYIIRF